MLNITIITGVSIRNVVVHSHFLELDCAECGGERASDLLLAELDLVGVVGDQQVQASDGLGGEREGDGIRTL